MGKALKILGLGLLAVTYACLAAVVYVYASAAIGDNPFR